MFHHTKMFKSIASKSFKSLFHLPSFFYKFVPSFSFSNYPPSTLSVPTINPISSKPQIFETQIKTTKKSVPIYIEYLNIEIKEHIKFIKRLFL